MPTRRWTIEIRLRDMVFHVLYHLDYRIEGLCSNCNSPARQRQVGLSSVRQRCHNGTVKKIFLTDILGREVERVALRQLQDRTTICKSCRRKSRRKSAHQ